MIKRLICEVKYWSCVCLLLSGCQAPAQVPVEVLSAQYEKYALRAFQNRHEKQTVVKESAFVSRAASHYKSHYKVRSGDTLYSISLSYNSDYKTLARHNGLTNPYQIYPGQLLKIPASSVTSATNRYHRDTGYKNKPDNEKQIHKKNGNSSRKKVLIEWTWPLQGKVLKGFSQGVRLNKGIDIAGRRGTPVRSAADGEVVYTGNGLRGYGNLVIIKHAGDFLTAYGHNSRILVKEEQRVKAGEKVAEIGSSGTDSDRLHFEIRLAGKPVDPLHYLP